MTVKKKVLIALLSTTCVAAAATGLAACKNPPKQDPAYTVTAIDQNGNGVEGVTFRIGYYQNYTTNYVYKDTDSGKVPVLATTDKNGKATFTDFTPEEDITYYVYLAESTSGERVYPYGYSLSMVNAEFDENWYATYEFTYAPSSFSDNPNVAIEYYRTFDDTNYDGEDADTMEYVEYGETTITLNLKKGIHTYFTFQSYKELGTDEGYDSTNENIFQGSDKLDYNQRWATLAAAGVYNVSFATTGNTAATMYNFSGMGYVYTVDQYNDATGAETPTNEIGVPYNKINKKSGNKGTIQLELTASGNISRATQFFGICAESDCSVTVSLERVGDAEEPPEIPTTDVTPSAEIEKYGAQSGTLTLMTIDGSLATVYNAEDKLYHVGTKNGPVLHVNLTKAFDRVGDCSIIDLGTSGGGNPYWTTGYIFPVYEKIDGELKHTATYNYADFLKAYADNTNSDGVYPVNQEIYDFLQLLAAKGQMKETQTAGVYAWLLPCQYYMPAEGMDVTGAGTQANPFILIGTTNKIDLSGFSDGAYAQFTATTAGIYTFAVSGCTIAVNGNNAGFFDNNLLRHICLAENESIIFTVDGTGSASITVGNATAAVIEPFFGDDSGAEDSEPSKGLTENNAIQLTSNGYSAFVVDKEINPDGVWVYVNPPIFGTIDYTFEIKSPLGQIVYDNVTYQYGETLKLTCSGGTKYAFLLTAKDGSGNVVNGIYAFEWKVVEKQSSGNTEMQLGDNSVTLSAAESYDGVEYSFTATESGTYIMTVDNDDAAIYSTDYEDYVIGLDGSYIFNLEEGETLYFLCTGPYDTAVSYNVNIAPYTVTGDSAFTDEGGTKHIVLDNSNCESGVEFTFVSTTGGTYTISVSESSSAMIYMDSASNNEKDKGVIINTVGSPTSAPVYSYEFTLEEGGYITFAGYAPNSGTGEYDVTITKN